MLCTFYYYTLFFKAKYADTRLSTMRLEVKGATRTELCNCSTDTRPSSAANADTRKPKRAKGERPAVDAEPHDAHAARNHTTVHRAASTDEGGYIHGNTRCRLCAHPVSLYAAILATASRKRALESSRNPFISAMRIRVLLDS